jgi:hypothetical protein
MFLFLIFSRTGRVSFSSKIYEYTENMNMNEKIVSIFYSTKDQNRNKEFCAKSHSFLNITTFVSIPWIFAYETQLVSNLI